MPPCQIPCLPRAARCPPGAAWHCAEAGSVVGFARSKGDGDFSLPRSSGWNGSAVSLKGETQRVALHTRSPK